MEKRLTKTNCRTAVQYEFSNIFVNVLVFQRSYRKELFDDAIARMRRACIKTELEIEKFRLIQERVENMVIRKAREEKDYGEVPDEFKGKYNMVEMLNV